MNVKKAIGLLILIVGIILVIFAVYNKARVAAAKEKIATGKQMSESFFPKNPASEVVGGKMQAMASQYDEPLKWILIGGVVLIVIGGGMLIFGRKRK
jgi:uncharacterized membrane protein HdeD (DUF308 family)